MGKLSDIMKGTRAIKRVALPLVNVPSHFSPDVPELKAQQAADQAAYCEPGEPAIPNEVMVGLRVLTLEELATIYQKAGEFAQGRGVKEPNDSDPIYNLGIGIYTCAIACVDPDSDVRDPDPFFGKRGDIESAALEILSSVHVGRDGIAYLSQAHEQWQELNNPQANKIHPAQFEEVVKGLADKNIDEAMRTFLALRPGMQFRSACFMANLLKTSLLDKFLPGATSAETPQSGSESQS